MNTKAILGAILLASSAVAVPALAATANGTLQVTLTIVNDCQLQTAGGGNNAVLDFGVQKAGKVTTPIDGASTAGGDIRIDCTNDAPNPKISFSAGANAVGDQRRMRFDTGDPAGPSLVQYDLFIDSGRKTKLIPGQRYDLVPDPLPNGLLRGINSIKVFGQVPTGEDLVNTNGGSYVDLVNFQVEL